MSMAMNKSILVKIKEKTNSNPKMQEFLADIFQFECSPKNGWYEKKYVEILEAYYKGEENANNRNTDK